MVDSLVFVSLNVALNVESGVVVLTVPEMCSDIVCGCPSLHVDYFPHLIVAWSGVEDRLMMAALNFHDVPRSHGSVSLSPYQTTAVKINQ